MREATPIRLRCQLNFINATPRRKMSISSVEPGQKSGSKIFVIPQKSMGLVFRSATGMRRDYRQKCNLIWKAEGLSSSSSRRSNQTDAWHAINIRAITVSVLKNRAILAETERMAIWDVQLHHPCATMPFCTENQLRTLFSETELARCGFFGR